MPKLYMPLNMFVCAASFSLTLPAANAIFPQMTKVITTITKNLFYIFIINRFCYYLRSKLINWSLKYNSKLIPHLSSIIKAFKERYLMIINI